MVIVVLMIILISVVCDDHNCVEPDDPSHRLLQALSVGKWHHGYHDGNDVDLCVCKGNGVEPELFIQASSVGEWHIHKEGNVWLEDDNFKVQCVSE